MQTTSTLLSALSTTLNTSAGAGRSSVGSRTGAREGLGEIEDLLRSIPHVVGDTAAAAAATAGLPHGEPALGLSAIPFGSVVVLRSARADAVCCLSVDATLGGLRVQASGVGVGRDAELFALDSVAAAPESGHSVVVYGDAVTLRCVGGPAAGGLLCMNTTNGELEVVSDGPGQLRRSASWAVVHPGGRTGHPVDVCDPVLLMNASVGMYLQLQCDLSRGVRLADAPIVRVAPAERARDRGGAWLEWHVVPAGVPFTPEWARFRPYLTGAFLLDAHPIDTLVWRDGEAKPYPVGVQDALLVDELLYAMLGVEGTLVRLKRAEGSPQGAAREGDGGAGAGGGVSELLLEASALLRGQHPLPSAEVADVPSSIPGVTVGRATVPDFDLELDERGLDEPLARLARRVLPLCSCYLRVSWFVERRSMPEAGVVPQALAAAARALLREYALFVSQLEARQRSPHGLSLQRLWYLVQPSLQGLSTLDKVLFLEPSAKGGALLNVIHAFSARSGDSHARSLALFLLERASAPYLAMLAQWLAEGRVADRRGEFMIEERPLSRETLKSDFNSQYWDVRYTIRQGHVPTFLAPHAQTLLTAGKYVSALQQCGLEADSPVEGPIPFHPDSRAYGALAHRAVTVASMRLLNHLLDAGRLQAWLSLCRHVLLVSHGDFLVHFLDGAAAELDKAAGDISAVRLNSLFTDALRVSVLANDAFKEELVCAVEGSTLVDHLEALHGVGGGGGPAAAPERVPVLELRGYAAFTLDLRVPWPVSIILSRSALAKYQLLFRHIFMCKHIERQLCSSWLTVQAIRSTTLTSHMHLTFSLLHKMLHFMQDLQTYMMFEVIEPRWAALLRIMRSTAVTTVDEVIHHHTSFLNTVLVECLLTHRRLFGELTGVTTLCSQFAVAVVDAVGGDGGAHTRSERAVNIMRSVESPAYQRKLDAAALGFHERVSEFLRLLENESATKQQPHLEALNTLLDLTGLYTRAAV